MAVQAKIISIVNQKGGVGKTTTAHAIGAGLAILKKAKVLFIDLDPQCNLTHTMACEGESGSKSVLLFDGSSKPFPLHCGKWDLIPSDPMLYTITAKPTALKEAIQGYKGQYDYIIIDTPPTLGSVTINALTASDYIIIPALADYYSLQGLISLKDTIEVIQATSNPALEIAGILLNRHNTRTILKRDLSEVINKAAGALNTKVFKQSIRDGIAIAEAQVKQADIFTYAPKSKPAADYSGFIKELVKRIQ